MLGVHPAAVSRALRDLKTDLLVEEASGPVRALTLTAAGMAMRERVESLSDEREKRMLKGFSEAEASRMLDYLERMLEHMDDVAALAEELPSGG